MIYQYRNNGYNIVLDVNSGSVHVVDDLVYDVMEMLGQGKNTEETMEALGSSYDPDEVAEAISECRELKKQGMLFTAHKVFLVLKKSLKQENKKVKAF